MPNPIMNAAVQALRDSAAERGNKSLLTFTPGGDAIMFVGADEPEVVDMFVTAMTEVLRRRGGGE